MIAKNKWNNTYAVKPVLMATCVKQPGCFKGQDYVISPMFIFTINWPVLNRHLFSMAILHSLLTGCLRQVWLNSDILLTSNQHDF